MASRRFGLIALLASCGCQVFAGMGGTAARDAGATSGTAGATGDAGAGSTAAADLDPLRDPRERHLRHVRQLTRSGWVAMPHFSADGRWIYVAEKRAKEFALLRVTTADPTKGPANAPANAIDELPSPDPAGAFWGLVAGNGEACAVTTKKPCASADAGTGWPDTEALLSCDTLSIAPLARERTPGAACPSPRGALPCALSDAGTEVCPVRVENGVRMILWKPGTTAGVPLGPAVGNSWMPSLSRNSARLVFVTRPATLDPSHLMVSFVDHPDPQPEAIGPEADRTLDPIFTPAGDRVIFASTADDAAGQELDLLMVGVIGGALERITFTAGVDRFPTFSPDGKSIAWVSERNADAHAQDLYIADWVADP